MKVVSTIKAMKFAKLWTATPKGIVTSHKRAMKVIVFCDASGFDFGVSAVCAN